MECEKLFYLLQLSFCRTAYSLIDKKYDLYYQLGGLGQVFRKYYWLARSIATEAFLQFEKIYQNGLLVMWSKLNWLNLHTELFKFVSAVYDPVAIYLTLIYPHGLLYINYKKIPDVLIFGQSFVRN